MHHTVGDAGGGTSVLLGTPSPPSSKTVSVWFAPLLPEELELLLLGLLLPDELELLLLELLEELELELLELELELLLEALLLPLLGAIGGATGSLGGGLDAYTLEKFRSRRVPPWRSISAALARM